MISAARLFRLPPVVVATVLLAAPATAQIAAASQGQVTQMDKRVGTLESQMRAVQRQVFPGGDKRFFTPEVTAPAAEPAAAPGSPATAPLVDLGQRVTALETQQRQLTGQVEQLQFQMRQLEEALRKSQGQADARLNLLEGKSGPAVPLAVADPTEPASPPAARGAAPARPADAVPATLPATAGKPAPTPAAPATAPAGDAPETAYRDAYALYTKGQHADAAKALTAFVAENPRHPRASNAQFWAGRALMADGKTADAAKAFLAGYQKFPRGERAHNSLLWLGRSLQALNQPKAACQALDQLATAYPDRLTGQFAADAAATRARAKCGA